jgi:hypothetical protein
MAVVGSACSLTALSANALELGDINIQSTLGHPLRASIAYALGPNEQLHESCIFLRSADPAAGIPPATHSRVTLRDGVILLTGDIAIREPLLNLRLSVDCPYSPHLQRDYVLMLNPGEPPREALAPSPRVASSETAVPARVMTVSQATPPATLRPRVESTPLKTGDSYRVQTGDTMSSIAVRIEDRTVGLWAAIDAIVTANPEAFIKGDVNRLMAGSTLTIPAFDDAPASERAAAEQASVADSPEPQPVAEATPAESPPIAPQATAPSELREPAISEPAATPEVSRSIPGMTIVGGEAPALSSSTEYATTEPLPVPASSSAEFVSPEEAELDTAVAAVETSDALIAMPDDFDATSAITDDLKPGDVIMPAQEPVAGAEITSRTASVVAPTVERPANSEGGWSNRLAWAGGGVLALLLAFFAFGRKLWDRLRPAPADQQSSPEPEVDEDDEPTLSARAIEELDLNFDDPEAANALGLDADFNDGSGLDDGDDVDVMQDFGFSAEEPAAAKLDHEILDDFTREPPAAPTDVIPPSHRIDESSILDMEIHMDELSGDYDLSMIVDATRQNIGNYDRTAQDLQAVQLDDDYTLEDGTLSREVDMEVLEQDYEQELKATQALNLEIDKAANELVDRLGEDELPGTPIDFDLTTLFDTTEESTSSATDMTGELAANLATDIDAENDESAASGTRRTVDKAAAGSDVTVDLRVDSDKADTRKN